MILVLLLLFSFHSAQAELPKKLQKRGDWNLVFEENFNSFNDKVWNKESLWKGSIGKALNYYDPENIEVKDGKLNIISKKARAYIKGKKYNYSSGILNSYGKFTFKYGYIEARMQMPKSNGLWAAFWLMPDRLGTGGMKHIQMPGRRSTLIEDGSRNGFTGKGMEIDIMEHLTEWGPRYFHQAAHWNGYGKDLKSKSHKKKIRLCRHCKQSVAISKDASSMTSQWHNFGLNWQPGLLEWYVDGKRVYRWKNKRVADVPMFILFNTALGGWADDHIGFLPDKTVVDYLKVYK